MPRLDGFEAARGIMAICNERGKFTPVVALSAATALEERERCKAAGMVRSGCLLAHKPQLTTLLRR